jgi:hypothetical protein
MSVHGASGVRSEKFEDVCSVVLCMFLDEGSCSHRILRSDSDAVLNFGLPARIMRLDLERATLLPRRLIRRDTGRPHADTCQTFARRPDGVSR